MMIKILCQLFIRFWAEKPLFFFTFTGKNDTLDLFSTNAKGSLLIV